MMRSMFAAISGLKNHQVFLDVVGNNIANINTTGFKAGRVTFQDILSQTLRAASSTTATAGGINAAQVGLGMGIGGIDTILTQGNLQATAKGTDLALQGEGYFVLREGNGQLNYTRDGGFDRLSDGRLVNPNSGFTVQGWMADAEGNINTNGPVGDLVVPVGQGVIGQVSTAAVISGNLNSDLEVGDTFQTTLGTFNALGGGHPVTLTFTKTGPNTWQWDVEAADDSAVTGYVPGVSDDPALRVIEFDPANGDLVVPADGLPFVVTPDADIGAEEYEVEIDFSRITQLAGVSDITSNVDGAPTGSLVSFSVANDGQIFGIYSNGLNRTLGQVALASFPNPGGLVKVGGNNYRQSANSGAVQFGVAGQGGRGEISAGFLEMSNVDLAQEFTNMIIANRGFQANSRVISTSDEMLQDLVNLKR